MKFAIFVLFALLAVVASTPIDKSKINPAFTKCANLCQDDSSKVLCASDGGKVQLSFLNDCVLKKYNCEHETKLTKTADKECPGSKGIRLS